ncbi:MAG: MgtC/SapB family protein, partial [Gammaproteobacteria bacterium]
MPFQDLPLPEVLWRFAIALSIGLLIGLERGWQTREVGEGLRIAGMRTYALLALYGAVS